MTESTSKTQRGDAQEEMDQPSFNEQTFILLLLLLCEVFVLKYLYIWMMMGYLKVSPHDPKGPLTFFASLSMLFFLITFITKKTSRLPLRTSLNLRSLFLANFICSTTVVASIITLMRRNGISEYTVTLSRDYTLYYGFQYWMIAAVTLLITELKWINRTVGIVATAINLLIALSW